MARFLVDLWLDGYEDEEAMNKACIDFIEDSLDFSASSVSASKVVKYRILRISNNLADYPDCEKDTLEHPELVECVSDEMESFVYCDETKEVWDAQEFFLIHPLESFFVEG